MASALLVPMSVAAKVVTARTEVPSLGGKPFNKEAALDPGVHVHWALPDALTRAALQPDSKTKQAVFPGVPDLWLVVRLNPVPANPPPKFKRGWAGFVVDSRAPKMTPLAQWQPTPTPAGAPVHTVAGLLPQARPGWGRWDEKHQFDIASAAYYPAARNRFGFYDSLAGLAQKQGKVSYVVVGWYSSFEHDPLHNAEDPDDLLDRLRLAVETDRADHSELPTLIARGAAPRVNWRPAGLALSPDAAPSQAQVLRVARAAARGGERQQRMQRLNRVSESVGEVSADVFRDVVEVISQSRGPDEIICHGSVVDVPLQGVPSPAPIKGEQVKLYPSIHRAMAAVAAVDMSKAAGDEAERNLDLVEMMLDDAEQNKGTLAGLLDMPGLAHARSFQGVPGVARRYLRIDVYHRIRTSEGRSLGITSGPNPSNRVESRHWPVLPTRSVRLKDEAAARVPPAHAFEVPVRPDDADWEAWVDLLKARFDQALLLAGRGSQRLHPRLVRVQDHRRQAQPLAAGRSADGSGSNQAGYWLDMEDADALKEFYASARGANVHMPDVSNVFEQPGPRWYRPWSPQLVLMGQKDSPLRSFRFGEDGRFRDDGFMECRVTGDTLTGIKLGSARTVSGRESLADSSPLGSRAEVPPEARALVEETMLLASDSGPVLAAQVAGSAADYQNAVQGLWVSRVAGLASQVFGSVGLAGRLPSPVALTPWKDPQEPLFVDTNYSHLRIPLAGKWVLDADHVETKLKQPGEKPTAVFSFDERARLASSVIKVLDSRLVTKLTLDKYGNPQPANAPPDGVDENTFLKVEVISAALTNFDRNLFDAGLRERSGALRLNRLNLVDAFGFVRGWDSGSKPESPDGGPSLGWWTLLNPRLPFWSRLQYRLQAASDTKKEADPFAPAVCGFLLPDFVEHSVEVFDGAGQPVGQLSTSPPRLVDKPPPAGQGLLSVKFEPHPWIGHTGRALDAIKNDVLRRVVAGIEAQSADASQAKAGGWVETGLTALLRVVDTVRGTLDPTAKIHDRRVRLLGEPIVVLSTRLVIEATGAESPSQLAQADPPGLPLLTTPPALPTVRVSLGDVTRPDDGLLGCFLPHDDPRQSRFAPVSQVAAEKAIVNGLLTGAKVGPVVKVTHPFIQGLSSEFDVPANQPRDLIVLMDTRGGIYVSSGVLPRKKITLPREQLEAALKGIEATFATGPVLLMPGQGDWKPALAPVAIEGYDTEFMRRGSSGGFVGSALPPSAPTAELPLGRVMITSGWLRMLKLEKPNKK